MKTNHKLKQQSGFTIIEVLIVLAIAGLIMLIVFLAVPALQRNSRNTQRRNDVAAVVGAVNEFVSNHSGSVPSSVGGDSSASGSDAEAILKGSNARGISKIVINNGGASTPITLGLISILGMTDGVAIMTGTKCGNVTPDTANVVAAAGRSISVVFTIETSSGRAMQCVDG